MERPIVNLDELEYEPWDSGFTNTSRPPERYGARRALIGKRLGARKLGYNVTRILPGKRAYPRHNHRVNEEMFMIVDGEGELRVGDATWPVRKGDIIACPPGGPEAAHQLVNTSTDRELAVFSLSTMELTDVIEYPDSAKVGYGVVSVQPDGKRELLRGMVRRDEAAVDYWEGE